MQDFSSKTSPTLPYRLFFRQRLFSLNTIFQRLPSCSSQLTQVLEQNYLAELTAFNKLLNRDKNTKIDVPDELIIPFDEISDAKTDLTLHPELMKYDKLFQSIEQSELLHKKNKKPMIGFGLDYIAVSERPNMTFNENGKDIVMPMLSVSIPVFNKKNASITKQNELKLQEVTFQKLERKNSLETALDKAIKNKTNF